MSTITTSTATNAISNAFGFPVTSQMDYNIITGELWIVFQDITNRGAIWKSSNSGTSWTFQGNFTVSGRTIEDIQEMRIDSAGDSMHMTLLVNNGTSEEMHYKRITIASGAPDVTGSVKFSGPAGSSQSLIYSSACVPVYNADGSIHIFLACAQRGTTSGVRVYAVTVRNDDARTTFVNDAIIGPTREWRQSGDDQLTVSLDVEHNGNGITASNPHVWVTWLKDTTIYCVRCTWKGYKSGWSTPSKAATVATGRSAERDVTGRWDGRRFVIMSPNPSANQQMQLFERNSTNSANTATRTSPSNGFGSLISPGKALSYNHVTQDARVFAAINSSVYWIDYIRATNSWGSWTSTAWGDPIGGSKSEFGLRRGTYGTAQYDAYIETGGSSPWTVASQSLAVNFAPTAPTWVTGGAGSVDTNGGAFDVSSSLVLDWDFHDPNAADTQQSFALQRQIGAGTIQWWRTSDSTWQLAETFNTSSSTGITLAAANWVGAGGASDSAHIYKVSVKDSGGSIQSPYSIGLSVVPSTRVDPAVTSPTDNQILNSGVVPVTWTVAEQSAYRVKILPAIGQDFFTRTTSNGWGTADYGGAWTITGLGATSEYSVSSGTGRMQHTVLNQDHEIKLANVLADDINVLVGPVTFSVAATGAAVPWAVRARYLDANNFVDVRAFFNTGGGGPSVAVRWLLAGVETVSSFVVPSGISSTGPLSIRFVANGTDLMARMWNTANPEPTSWNVSLSGCPIIASGPIAIRTEVDTGNTNTLPVTFTTDGLIVSDASLASYDSGFLTDPLPLTPTVLSFTPPITLPDGYGGQVTLQTRNAEGCPSVIDTVPFTIDFVEPVTPTVVLNNTPTAGGLTVTTSQPALVGAQPATSRIDLWRRKVVTGTVNPANANPYFETNATDWTNSGYSTIARSTSQAHEGTASLLCTPNGSTATPKAQTTALYAATAGGRYEMRAWVRSTTANKTVRLYIDWYDNTPTLISSSTQDLTSVAGTWVYGTVRATAPLGTTQARIAIGQLATPAAGDTLFGDELQLMGANDDTGIRINIDVNTGQGYVDWRSITGIDYEYRAAAYADNGTFTYGPWVD
jgi:hypothetical protein